MGVWHTNAIMIYHNPLTFSSFNLSFTTIGYYILAFHWDQSVFCCWKIVLLPPSHEWYVIPLTTKLLQHASKCFRKFDTTILQKCQAIHDLLSQDSQIWSFKGALNECDRVSTVLENRTDACGGRNQPGPILTSSALAKFGITYQSGFGRFAARKYLTSDTQIIGSNEREIFRNFSESSEQNSQLHFATPLWELPVLMMLFSGILLFETIEIEGQQPQQKIRKGERGKAKKPEKKFKMRCILVPRGRASFCRGCDS